MAQLVSLLLGKFERAEHCHAGAVAQSGNVVNLAAQQSAEATQRLGAEVLDIDVDYALLANDRDFAEQITRRTARCGTQRQTDIDARQIIGQQQIALCILGVEHRLLGQLFEVGRNHRFRRPCIAAHTQPRKASEDHAEIGHAIGQVLFGNFNRGEIALRAQDRVRLRANIAQHRERKFAADIAIIGIVERKAGHFIEPAEFDARQRQLDIGIFGAVEHAGRALHIAIDCEGHAALFTARFGRGQLAARGRRYLRRKLGLRGNRFGGKKRDRNQRKRRGRARSTQRLAARDRLRFHRPIRRTPDAMRQLINARQICPPISPTNAKRARTPDVAR